MKNSTVHRYGFVLSGGLAWRAFTDGENYWYNLKPGQTLWYVDADAFTFEQALSMAQQKAAELQAIKEAK